MMRQMAQLAHDFTAKRRARNELQEKAAALLPAVLGLYKKGDGVWNAYHLDGTLRGPAALRRLHLRRRRAR